MAEDNVCEVRCAICESMCSDDKVSWVMVPGKNGDEQEAAICPKLICLELVNRKVKRFVEYEADREIVRRLRDKTYEEYDVEVHMIGWKPSEVPDFWEAFKN